MDKTAQNTSKRYIGDVYFNNDEMMHLRSFIHTDGSISDHDCRSRIAYVIISQEETIQLVGDKISDNSYVLEQAKYKYLPMLIDAVEQEFTELNEKLPYDICSANLPEIRKIEKK